jgi:phospholipid transport system substrate-binding protein
MQLRRLSIVLTLLVCVIPTCLLADAIKKKNATKVGAEKVVTATVNRVLETLEQNKDEEDDAKRAEMREGIRQILLEVVDMRLVSTLALANYKRKFSEEEFGEFSEIFSRLLFSKYISHLEKYTDEAVEIVETKQLTASKVLVETIILSGKKKIPLAYSMVRRDENWTLYDVRIEGVSLIKNYRSQFREVLRKKTPKDLIERIAKKVAKNDAHS